MIILSALAPLTAYAANSPLITVNQVIYAITAFDDTFTYILKPLEPGNPMPAGSTAQGYTFTITGTGSVEIELPNYNRQGLYLYELSQVIATKNPGYTYDRRVYTIEVHVDAALDVKVVVFNENGTKAEEITFQNTYNITPSDPNLMSDPTVRKTVFGNPSRNSTFTFRLEPRSSSYPMPPGSENGVKTIYITGSGMNEFGVWSYDKAGTYYYTVYEVNTRENGYTYDTAIYTITDMVKEENGTLVLTRVVTNDLNKPVTSLIFNNYYYPGGSGGGGTDPPNPINPPSGGNDKEEHYHVDDPDVPGGGFDQEDHYIDGPDIPGGGLNIGNGPKTGDDSNITFYRILFILSGMVAIGAMTYLIAGGKRKGVGDKI